MATTKQQKTITRFKSVEILKTQKLGIGSYGSVYKAKCDDLVCAAKILHPTLFDPTAQHQVTPRMEHRLPMRRFEQECDFLATIRHPNIVQYLGMHQDPDTGLPVLLLELMDDSLTHFLDSSSQAIPYHIQVNICHDISLALSFLHSNNIIHRDLSSNNVLLIGNLRAKVTDFGMAKLSDLNPHASHFSFTMCPGTDVFMPPEAVRDRPVYTEKMDCFSFGVIIIHVLTRKFPKPGERRREIRVVGHRGVVEQCISEIERRQNHISQIDPTHPLLSTALECLKDRNVERLSARQICERLGTLKESAKYTDSMRQHVEQAQDLQLIIHSQSICLHEKDQIIEDIIKERDRIKKDKDCVISSALREIRQLQEETIKQKELAEQQHQQQCEYFQKQIYELVQKLNERGQGRTQHMGASNRAESGISIRLRWREGEKTPRRVSSRHNAAAVNGITVFVRLYDRTVYGYTVTGSTSTWSRLPSCPSVDCPMVIVNDVLTTVGGLFGLSATNLLFSLTGKGDGTEWTKEFPPMPTKRSEVSTLCSRAALIVAGGFDGRALTTVEVMNTETLQWSTVTDLPESVHGASSIIHNDHMYILGGFDKNSDTTKAVYTCSLTTLLLSHRTLSLRERLTNALSAPNRAVWSRAADLPLASAACVSLCGRLLAIGGKDLEMKPSTAVHMYNPATNSWEVTSHLSTARCDCIAAVLPDNQLVVVGGRTKSSETDSVEVATLL